MIQNERDSVGIQPDVERIQHCAEHGHPIVRLQHLRCVCSHDGDAVAGANASSRQRIGQLG